MTVHVLFVCLGNICRSPMAEGVFQKLVAEAGLSDQISIDSVGTGSWHIGERPHPGTRRLLAKHNIPYDGRARQIQASDFSHAPTYIIGMDDSNTNNVQRQYGRQPHLYRLLDFASDTNEKNVPDPYYTNNFETVYELVLDGCQGLLETIRRENGL